jgi:hypothetical protein
MSDDVFIVHNSHIWETTYPYSVCECGYEVRFSINVWAGVVGDIVTCDLIGSLLKCIENFWKLFYQARFLAVRQRFWFQHNIVQHKIRKVSGSG